MCAPIADFFSLLPQCLVNQAFYCDYAPFPTLAGEVMLAFWVRIAKVEPEDGVPITGDGRAFGHELVAYHCDLNGSVLDWERRYEVTTTQGGSAIVSKLKMLLANGLAPLCNYEGLLEEMEDRWAESLELDWEQMPGHIQ